MDNTAKIQSIKKSHPFKWWDIAVYVLIVAAVILLLIAASRPQGSAVEIIYYDADNKLVTIVKDLNKDQSVEIKTDGGVFIIKIEDGKVWVEHTDCRDRVCVGMGKISRVNQQIVCLPNKVTIIITGESMSDGEV